MRPKENKFQKVRPKPPAREGATHCSQHRQAAGPAAPTMSAVIEPLAIAARSAGGWAAGRIRVMIPYDIPEKAHAFQGLVGLVYPAPLDRVDNKSRETEQIVSEI
jgi:hypothetical protein